MQSNLEKKEIAHKHDTQNKDESSDEKSHAVAYGNHLVLLLLIPNILYLVSVKLKLIFLQSLVEVVFFNKCTVLFLKVSIFHLTCFTTIEEGQNKRNYYDQYDAYDGKYIAILN